MKFRKQGMAVFWKNAWKGLGVVLVAYSLVAGLNNKVPALPILNESIRNLFFHVPMWFAMMFCIFMSMINSVKFLKNNDLKSDVKAHEFAKTGLLFGFCGLFTGMIWAKMTWGAFWTNDPKLNGSAISMLIYLAYLVLRNSIEGDDIKRAKIASVYNIFAFAAYIPLVFILPRMTDSLHPGNGGNPAFSSYDLDSAMRPIFYSAVLGWILIGNWVTNLNVRLFLLNSNE
ncbi:MAG: cytochrome c biogenesis protein CcsA [Cytophagales bacterium]